MQRGIQGTYTISEFDFNPCQAFVPHPLPPDPPLEVQEPLLHEAILSLGRLDGITKFLGDTRYMLLYFYIRREAVLSSQIEGSMVTVTELLSYETEAAPGMPIDDVREVSTYVQALEGSLTKVRERTPICGRLIRDAHLILLSQGRGWNKSPGIFRNQQVAITRKPGQPPFYPPPPDQLDACMKHLEKFIITTREFHPLVQAGLAHLQFETIHPFFDGNGRVGRMLIPLMLCEAQILSEPMLYLSLYIKHHRDEYYGLLEHIRYTGDWETWIEWFLQGTIITAGQAAEAASRINDLYRSDRESIRKSESSVANVLRVHEFMMARPVTTARILNEGLGITVPTVQRALNHLQTLGVVREMSGRKRDRVYAYDGLLTILEEGTEPLGDTGRS